MLTHQLSARRVRVGDIELELLDSPPVQHAPLPQGGEREPEEAHLTPEEEEAEIQALLYGASEGVDAN